MKNILQLSYLVPLFPLLGFLICGLGRKVLGKSMISIIGMRGNTSILCSEPADLYAGESREHCGSGVLQFYLSW